MAGKKKFYAVKVGRKPGLYTSWEACKKQVEAYPGALFKGFVEKEQAEAYLSTEALQTEGKKTDSLAPETVKEEEAHIFVDGSFNAKTGLFGYGLVAIIREGIHESCGSLGGGHADHRNVAGELMAAEKAMDYCQELGKSVLYLYYDYAGIRHWAKKEWKANYPLTRAYREKAEQVMERIELHFVKVAAHTGVDYNERADRLAKKGCGILQEKTQKKR